MHNKNDSNPKLDSRKEIIKFANQKLTKLDKNYF
jgi:hypothetical protein